MFEYFRNLGLYQVTGWGLFGRAYFFAIMAAITTAGILLSSFIPWASFLGGGFGGLIKWLILSLTVIVDALSPSLVAFFVLKWLEKKYDEDVSEEILNRFEGALFGVRASFTIKDVLLEQGWQEDEN